jgi:hypothetical protein
MLIFCRTNDVRSGGLSWRIPLPCGWEMRWQKFGCSITAMPPHLRGKSW